MDDRCVGAFISSPMGQIPTEGSVRLRVRYVECDPMGVAHHSSYVPWLEMARTELLRGSGRTYAEMERGGLFLVITKLDVKYRRPIRYDDVVDVRVRASVTSRIKIHHAYELAVVERDGAPPRPDDPSIPHDGVCAVASTELACVGRDGRPTALPEWLRASAD